MSLAEDDVTAISAISAGKPSADLPRTSQALLIRARQRSRAVATAAPIGSESVMAAAAESWGWTEISEPVTRDRMRAVVELTSGEQEESSDGYQEYASPGLCRNQGASDTSERIHSADTRLPEEAVPDASESPPDYVESIELTSTQRAFIESNRSAAMITVGDDGYAKAVRVGVAVIDGRIWSSGTVDRVRTGRVRHDPRCTLFVFGSGSETLTLETKVSIIEDSDAVAGSVRLFRTMQGRPEGPLMWYRRELGEEGFRRAMVEERRLIYVFDPIRGYGVE